MLLNDGIKSVNSKVLIIYGNLISVYERMVVLKPFMYTVKKIRRLTPGIWLPFFYRYFYGHLPVEHI